MSDQHNAIPLTHLPDCTHTRTAWGCQEWMAKTVQREVASSAVDLQGLLEGRAAAFLHVHTAGMLALVADPPTPAAPAGQMGGQMAEGGCPETLQFDEHRMGLLRAEFRYISLASAMLVTVAHGLTAARTEPQVPRTPMVFPPSLAPSLVPELGLRECGACGSDSASPHPPTRQWPQHTLQLTV